ncbi:MAG: thermonuclease family protein [Pseudanabaenaceae cyanobacterium bins.68]|nr:thermonuclease family protein [Pseudanabaenaceae cyanobacterium bins.68]
MALIFCLILLLSNLILPSEAIAGYRLNFYDGDNFILIQGGIKTKVGLACLKAPELSQSGGQAARKALKNLVDRQQFSLRVINKDPYGRLLAEVYAGGKNVNQTLLEQGYAVYHGEFRRECDRYQKFAQIAQQQKIGIWRSSPAAPALRPGDDDSKRK